MSASAAQAHKRTSTVSSITSPPAPNHHIHPSATVHEKAVLTGSHDINIAAHAVVHPYAKLVATYAPLNIGEGCVLWERASVGMLEGPRNGSSDSVMNAGKDEKAGVLLEKHVTVEANAIVEAAIIGKGSIVEVGARVGRGAVIGQYCKLAPLTEVTAGETLPDYTVLYGGDNMKRVNQTLQQSEQLRSLQEKGHLSHLQVMRRLIDAGVKKI